MTIVYAESCDCDLIEKGCAYPGLKIKRISTPREAFEALRHAEFEWARSFSEERPGIERYHSIHGPGGHVLRVILPKEIR